MNISHFRPELYIFLIKIIIIFISFSSTDTELVYHIRVERDEFVLGMQLLNPFHNYTTESLHIYDYKQVKESSLIKVWNVTRDIASFPTITSRFVYNWYTWFTQYISWLFTFLSNQLAVLHLLSLVTFFVYFYSGYTYINIE